MRHFPLFAVLLLCLSQSLQAQAPDLLRGVPFAFSQDGTRIRLYSTEVKEPVKIFVISDTHLFLSDEREDPFREYSQRMAAAYNTTRHFQTHEATDPERAFRATLALAQERGADAIALLGDIVSYPTEAGVELAVKLLNETGIPWFYTTGNHDWHYEGLSGTEIELRETWPRPPALQRGGKGRQAHLPRRCRL